MKPIIAVPVVLSLMLSTALYGFSSGVGRNALAQSRPQKSIAEIIKAEGGRVELKRQDWTLYQPTKQGETLNLGDLLRVTKGTKVVVQCSFDKTMWTVPDDGLPWGVANTCSPPE